MRVNEFVTEGILDSARAALYRTTGIGGQAGLHTANKVRFINGFKAQYKLARDAAKDAGMPFDPMRMATTYMAKYGWQADPGQLEYLKNLTTSPVGKPLAVAPEKIANAMYSIGMQQNRDSQGYIAGAGGYSSGGYSQGGRRGKKAAQAPELSVTTERIVATINKLVGRENLDDLSAIAKAAMQTLYKQDKEKYTELYKEIMTGQKAEPEEKPLSPEEQFAQKRQAKLKAATAAADAGSNAFSKMPGAAQAEPAPKTPEEAAARRIAKQKAAMAAINGQPAQPEAPAAEKPVMTTKVDATTTPPASIARNDFPSIKGPNGQPLPTQPSMNPRQFPGSLASMNQKISSPAKKPTKRPTRTA